MQISKGVKEAQRIREIAVALIEEGFGFLVSKSKFSRRLPATKKLKAYMREQHSTPNEVKLRKTLEKLGPTFIKLGQILSIRPDLVPKEYTKELEELQDNVPPFSYKEVQSTIKKELGRTISSIFSSFDKTPIASASISQVHKARLRSGELVAVKIQRPDVRELMQTDIRIMKHFAQILEKHSPIIAKYKPIRIIEEFSDWSMKELNFLNEANNIHGFYDSLRNSPNIKIPKVYDDYTTEKVLITEFIEGIELHNTKEIKRKRLDIKKIVENGFNAIIDQVFINGVFHADPHPGNILVLKNCDIAFVDFGIVGFFDDDLKNSSIDLLYGIMYQDVDQIIESFYDMDLIDDEISDAIDFKTELKQTIAPLSWGTLKNVKISQVLENVLSLSLKHGIRIPMQFVLLGKTIVTIEGVALELDPNFNIHEHIAPVLRRLMLKRRSPNAIIRDTTKTAMRLKHLFSRLPERTDKILTRLEKGQLKIDIDDTDIRALSVEMDKSSNRLSYSMIIAALVVAAAFIWPNQNRFIMGIPLFSFCLLFIALIFMIVLLTSILKERKRD